MQTNLISCFVLFWSIVYLNVHVNLPILQCIGKVGKIKKINANGDVHIDYGLKTWVFHPDTVTKVIYVISLFVCLLVFFIVTRTAHITITATIYLQW